MHALTWKIHPLLLSEIQWKWGVGKKSSTCTTVRRRECKAFISRIMKKQIKWAPHQEYTCLHLFQLFPSHNMYLYTCTSRDGYNSAKSSFLDQGKAKTKCGCRRRQVWLTLQCGCWQVAIGNTSSLAGTQYMYGQHIFSRDVYVSTSFCHNLAARGWWVAVSRDLEFANGMTGNIK